VDESCVVDIAFWYDTASGYLEGGLKGVVPTLKVGVVTGHAVESRNKNQVDGDNCRTKSHLSVVLRHHERQ